VTDVVFKTQAVTKVYETGDVKVYALAGVDLELFAGELTVLLGPSGSGKSTLLNILGGLDHATDGRVWFEDTELTNLPDRGLTKYRRDHVGFVFQFYNLVPSLTARENVQLVTDVAVDPMPAEEALELVGLAKRMDHFPSEMQVLEVLRDINERFGTTTVVITHNAEIQRMAHRVIFFQDGKISEVIVNKERLSPSEIVW